MTFNLGFIGGGNMSTAIAKGILRNKVHPASKMWVSGPRLHTLTSWTELGANVTTKNGEVLSRCEIVFLGIKPGMLLTAVTDCLNTLPEEPINHRNIVFVSMLAGISIAEVRKALTPLTKHARVIRIMPNTPLTVGAGACLYTPDVDCNPEQCAIVEALMSSCGVCEKVPESLMDSLGSLVGCGPAYMYIVIEALADGAVKQGSPRDLAQRLAAQMVMGSALMVLQSGKHPGLLKDEVCSPGGSTIAGIACLEDMRIRSAFIQAIEASTLKSKELGKK